MMRRVSVVFCLVTALVLSVASGEAQDRPERLRDPYLATTTTAILNADRLRPRLKREIVHVAGLPGRNQVPGLEGRGNLSVAFYRQDRPAPLVFILAGLGSNPYFGHGTYYAYLFHREGAHVVILPSPVTWNFALAASRSGAPGYAPDDARDLYDVMQRILATLTTRYSVAITSVDFLGTSLGALEGAYLSVIDAAEGRIGIGKYVLVNPPLDLSYALAKVDDWHALGAKFGKERAKGIVGKALGIVESFSKDSRDDPRIYEMVAADFARFTTEELQFLVAQDLQASLPELVSVAQILQSQQARAPAGKDEVRKRLQESTDMTLARYCDEITLPVWRLQWGEPHADLDSFLRRGSLASILPWLRGNPRVHVVHNADDFLSDRRSIEDLKEALGDQMTLYLHGGHLGNVWHPTHRALVLGFFR
jgi:hypothetical protein